ncbi:MAG: DinB family protein [Tepidiformaceae bacterium]
MGESELVRRLARWNVWANSLVGAALEESGGEPVAALAAYQHVFETELTWLRRIEGHASPNVPLWGPPDFPQTRVWRAEAEALMAHVATSADEMLLSRRFSYSNSRGEQFTDGVEMPLFQVFMHSQQYRGEAAGFLNAAGYRVPDFDLIFWARLGEPEA